MPDESKTVFVACPIGAEDSPVRKQSDQLMKFIIKPVADDLGFVVERADLIVESGLITAQIFNRLATVPLVLADLSGHNPNVFYELAVRHAVRKPVIHLIAKGQTIPFDVANNRTLFYELELEAVERAKLDLRSMIDAALAESGPVESPISDALERVELSTSNEPVERRDAELLSMVSDIRTRLGMLEAVTRSSITDSDALFDLERSIERFSDQMMARTQSSDAIALLRQMQHAYVSLQGILFTEGQLSSTQASKLRHPTRANKLRYTQENLIEDEDLLPPAPE